MTNPQCRCPDQRHTPPNAAPENVLAKLPQRIHAARTRKNMTMRDLAAEIGVSVSTIHRIESRRAQSPLPKWFPAMMQWLTDAETGQ
ncbi:Helix-turn-helix domain-containing protein [Amycolatopsis pretoriensis]|uniref:Helix-turn-helix domain-containing protein n=1 Tax=Amycolatopsis pretoriensis TaxID=218821 RepID=A0A1H5R7T1_9PSEU|nr:helix-turn-helix transcriptional regulator [Amycolatopsis pretoriensis]SEF34369.1 Helix-turn-helix domain-containing protein [Amycolatopsis pretoriensis]